MARPKRLVTATVNETLNPPAVLESGCLICRVVKAEGKNLYSVEDPKGQSLLVELPPRFRSSIWIKRNSFVVVNTSMLQERENKLGGGIQNVIGDFKAWRKMSYWPVEFSKPGSSWDDDASSGADSEEVSGLSEG